MFTLVLKIVSNLHKFTLVLKIKSNLHIYSIPVDGNKAHNTYENVQNVYVSSRDGITGTFFITNLNIYMLLCLRVCVLIKYIMFARF